MTLVSCQLFFRLQGKVDEMKEFVGTKKDEIKQKWEDASREVIQVEGKHTKLNKNTWINFAYLFPQSFLKMFGGQGGREVSFSSNRIMGALRSPQVRKKLKRPLPSKTSAMLFEFKYFFLIQGSPRQSDDDSDEEEEETRGNGSPQKTPESNGARAKVKKIGWFFNLFRQITRHFYFSDPLPTEATERGGRWKEEGQRGAPGDPGGGGLFRKTEQEGLIQKQKYLIFSNLFSSPSLRRQPALRKSTRAIVQLFFCENYFLKTPLSPSLLLCVGVTVGAG